VRPELLEVIEIHPVKLLPPSRFIESPKLYVIELSLVMVRQAVPVV
jgi:hypothetical protein